MFEIKLKKKIQILKQFYGSLYRIFIIKLKINFYIKKKCGNFFYLLHAYFFFFNLEKWTLSQKNKNFKKLIKSINRKSCFIDVGAHAGFFSIVASKKNKRLAIHSFEPSRNFFFLKNHIKYNNLKNISAQKLLVSNKNCKREFYEQYVPSPTGSLLKKTTLKFTYTGTTIDSYVKKKNIKPDIIKIDAEGDELNVLLGAKQTLMKFYPDIYLSYHPQIFEKYYSRYLFIKFIKDVGYRIYNIENGFLNESIDKKTELFLKK
jgi:FkbM family methyltransferase